MPAMHAGDVVGEPQRRLLPEGRDPERQNLAFDVPPLRDGVLEELRQVILSAGSWLQAGLGQDPPGEEIEHHLAGPDWQLHYPSSPLWRPKARATHLGAQGARFAYFGVQFLRNGSA